jgi:hypothetical protein
MITVACVYWGTKFPVEYVHNLKSMVERNTTIEHRFVCLSDKKVEGVETKILKPGYDGWWNKLQLFDPAQNLGERVVYLDLDTLIVNNIDWLLNYKGNFMGIEDVGAVNDHQPHLKGVMQSGVMSFNPLMYTQIWNQGSIDETLPKKFRGDGEFLNAVFSPLSRDLLQNVFPGRLKSYKYQVYPNRPDDKTSIICFHGRPSVIQAMNQSVTTPMRTYEPQKWIKEYWR